MPVHVIVRAQPAACKAPPFAQLPHDIAADPRLSPVDVRVVAALLFWARDKASCWPCDRSIADRVGRSVSTIQRALRRLQALGLVLREHVPQTDANRTGRVLSLRWRLDRGVGHGCPALRSAASDAPRSGVTDECRREGERERPESDVGSGSPPPPAGDEDGDAPPTAEEIARFREWAAGADPVKARFGRAALKVAGIDAGAEVDAPSTPPTSPLPRPAPADHPTAPSPRAPRVHGSGGLGHPGAEVLKPPSPADGRHPGPSVPTAPGTSAPKVAGTTVPTNFVPADPRNFAPSVPIAGGPSDREYRSSVAPRPPGTSASGYLGAMALRLGGALVREGPRA